MNGLLKQENMNPSMSDQMIQDDSGFEVEEIEATPEEQAIYDQYIQAALGEVLGNAQVFESMMKAIESGRNNLIEGLARIALTLYEKAERKLGPLENDDIGEGVAEGIIEALLDMAVEGDVLNQNEVDEDVAQGVFYKMAQLWVEQNPDRADPEDVAYLQSMSGGV